MLRAQSKDVVMLGLWLFSGAFSDVGEILDRGMKLALEERGMKILGRPIKYITRDDGTKAGSATLRAEEAVDGEGAKYIIAPWSSRVVLAVSEVAKRKKVLHYFSGGTEDIARALPPLFVPVGGQFLTAAKTVVDNFMKANPKAKHWHLLVADYAFGGQWRSTSRKWQAARDRVHERRPASARGARVLEIRDQGRRQQARRGGHDVHLSRRRLGPGAGARHCLL